MTISWRFRHWYIFISSDWLKNWKSNLIKQLWLLRCKVLKIGTELYTAPTFFFYWKTCFLCKFNQCYEIVTHLLVNNWLQTLNHSQWVLLNKMANGESHHVHAHTDVHSFLICCFVGIKHPKLVCLYWQQNTCH